MRSRKRLSDVDPIAQIRMEYYGGPERHPDDFSLTWELSVERYEMTPQTPRSRILFQVKWNLVDTRTRENPWRQYPELGRFIYVYFFKL